MIIAVTGWPNAGKDTIGDILETEFGYTRLAMGKDILLPACKALDPVLPADAGRVHMRFNRAIEQLGYETSKEQIPEVREFMQRLGFEFLDAIGRPALWIECLMDKFRGGDAVMTSCRRRVECEAVYARGGLIWRVNRPGVDPGDHPVEHEVDDWPFDAVIVNDGTLDELAAKVRRAVGDVRPRRELTESVVWTDRELKRVDL